MAIRGISLALIGLSAVALPTLAGAQPAAGSAASLAWSKSDAIIGAPSALQAILAKQQAPERGAVAPASYSVPAVTRAVLRTDEGALTGRPDVFGTVALKVDHTRLDARWRAVENRKLTGQPARFAAALRKADAGEQLKLVNRYVNGRVHYVDDQSRFGRADVWSAANDTLRSGRGDCEDYAIAKFQLLRAAGFSERDLYLVIVRDLVRRADHAVLVARAQGHMYVLDNGTDDVLESAQVSDYRPVLTFASYGEWTHGYRVEVPTNVALADGQRSRSASLLALSAGLSK
jgi:predicted transglutaminase-like cysteine proteinase